MIKINKDSVEFKYRDTTFRKALGEGVKKREKPPEPVKKNKTFFKTKGIDRKPPILLDKGFNKCYLEYDDEKIILDIYNPDSWRCPVVILIHGAAGIEGNRAVRYKGFATDLMNKDIIAINVHYFDTKRRMNWTKTVLETINYSQRIKNADKNKIGLVGYSLGGTIALAVASVDNRVKLLAINAGYMPSGFSKRQAANLPRTLMLSGTEDTSIQTLNQLSTWFKGLGIPFETKINPGMGHSVPMNIFNENWRTIVNFFVRNFK